MKQAHPTVLIVAGNDPLGFSGIATDIKSVTANGAHPMVAISALTVQDSCSVTQVVTTEEALLEAQIDAAMREFPHSVLKTGILPTSATIKLVKKAIARYRFSAVVVDPVLRSSSEDALSNDTLTALKALCQEATLVTPNLPEAKQLLGKAIESDRLEEAAKKIGKMLGCSVLLKGGHLETDAMLCDILYDKANDRTVRFEHPKIATQNSRGTGCALASAIAAHLAQDKALEEAVGKAIAYLQERLRRSDGYLRGRCSGGLDLYT